MVAASPYGSGRAQQVGGSGDHSYQSPPYGDAVRGEQHDTESTYTDFGREIPHASYYGRDRGEERSSYEPPRSEYSHRQEVRPQTHRDSQYGRDREERPYLQEHFGYPQRGESLEYNHHSHQEGYYETEPASSVRPEASTGYDVGYRGSNETYGETDVYQTQRGYGDYR